jgi:hypothetical protein
VQRIRRHKPLLAPLNPLRELFSMGLACRRRRWMKAYTEDAKRLALNIFARESRLRGIFGIIPNLSDT